MEATKDARARGSRRYPILLALAAIATAGLFAAYRWGGLGDPPPIGGATVTIAPGIHMIGSLGPSAVYVVESSEGLVLVDSGLEADAATLKAELAKLGLDWRQIRAILLTHAHGDHTGGAARLRAGTGARIYAGRGDAPIIRAGGPVEAVFSTFAMPPGSAHPTPVDVELSGDETIQIGDAKFRALALPGHSPGSVGYLLDRPGRRALFAGDVVMQLTGAKPLGIYTTYLAPRYRGNPAAYLDTLRKLRELPPPDLLLPGHPGDERVPISPKLPPGRWVAMIDQGIAELERLAARQQADGADFLDGEPKQLLPGLDYLGDYRGSALYAFTASGRFFLVDAPGGPGLAEFVEARLKQLGREPAGPSVVLLTGADPAQTAGLAGLVEKFAAEVVVGPAGVEAVRALVPTGTTVTSARALAGRGWPEVTAIPLRARGTAPVAYRVVLDGKTALISGRVPILFDRASLDGLVAELSGSRDRLVDYLYSVRQLAEPAPDLWLPAVPSDSQDANLYDDTWAEIIQNNYMLGSR